jgi:GNAT superfamily N-acetyltransferase
MRAFIKTIARVRDFLQGPQPLPPAAWEGRLSPRTFRRFDRRDLPQCLELYALNEPGRFPMGVKPQYEKSLTEGHAYHLVTDDSGQIVATGGVAYLHREDRVCLCFGLVHPGHQGRGIGTALLMARLAMLKPRRFTYDVFIFAVEASLPFYRRFGFSDYLPWRDPHGSLHPSGHMRLNRSDIRKCRELLCAHGIVLPDDEDQVPFRENVVNGNTGR